MRGGKGWKGEEIGGKERRLEERRGEGRGGEERSEGEERRGEKRRWGYYNSSIERGTQQKDLNRWPLWSPKFHNSQTLSPASLFQPDLASGQVKGVHEEQRGEETERGGERSRESKRRVRECGWMTPLKGQAAAKRDEGKK